MNEHLFHLDVAAAMSLTALNAVTAPLGPNIVLVSPQNHFEDDVKLPPVQAGSGYHSTTFIALMDVNPDTSPVRVPLKQMFHQD